MPPIRQNLRTTGLKWKLLEVNKQTRFQRASDKVSSALIQKIQDRCCPPQKRSQQEQGIVWEVSDYAKVACNQLKVFLTLANVHIHEFKRALKSESVHSLAAVRKILLSKREAAACLLFSKDHENKPEGFWNNATNFGLNKTLHVWRKKDTIIQHKNLIPPAVTVICISMMV